MEGTLHRYATYDPTTGVTKPPAGPFVPFTSPTRDHGMNQPGNSGGTAAGSHVSDAIPLESRGLQFLYAVLGARGMGVALTAAALDMLLMGSDGRSSLQFGAIVAFASSAGDAGASAAGIPTILDAYVTDTSYMDFTDFVGTGVMTGAMMYYFGQSGNQLWASMGMGAVAGGAGGKLGSMLLGSVMKTL